MFCIGSQRDAPTKSRRLAMPRLAQSCDLKELVAKFIPEMIGKEIEKATQSIYPLQNVFIRKGTGYSEDVGVKVDRPAEEAAPEAEVEVVGA
ncbi:hypothetical protein ACHQM5_021334 [Ranunculus cassubicifolius]